MSLPPLPNTQWLSAGVGHTEESLQAYDKACREQALEEAAVCAGIHYMDTCKSKNIAPASNEQWLVSEKIRSIK